MAEVLVIGKKISEMGLVNEITGEEKIPTSALGDKAVTTGQLLTYLDNNGVAQWGRISGDITNQIDLQNQFTQERDTLKSYTREQVSQQQAALQEHIDTTNEVFEYARENGSALPYREGISYEEGAVVVKEGVLQQWKGGEWRSAVAESLSDTIQTFNTPEAGVDPVIGVADGAYFNVLSSSDELYADEYQNVGGVPTPTGKSYPSAAYVQSVAKYTALPFVDGKAYSLNERVQLENGDIVKSTIDGNAGDPNIDMTGWTLVNNPDQIPYKFGSQLSFNERFVFPQDFGAEPSAKLSSRFSTLAAAKFAYANIAAQITSLDQSLFWAALQSSVVSLGLKGGGEVVVTEGDWVLSDPIFMKDNVTVSGRGKASNIVAELNSRWSRRSLFYFQSVNDAWLKNLKIDQNGRNRATEHVTGSSVIFNDVVGGGLYRVDFPDAGTSSGQASTPQVYLMAKDVLDDLTDVTDAVVGGVDGVTIYGCSFSMPDSNTRCGFAIRVMTDFIKQRRREDFLNFVKNCDISGNRFDGDFYWNHIELAGAGTTLNSINNNRFTGSGLTAVDFDKGCCYNTAQGNIVSKWTFPANQVSNPAVRLSVFIDHGSDGYLNKGNKMLGNHCEQVVGRGSGYESLYAIQNVESSLFHANSGDGLVGGSSSAGVVINNESYNVVVSNSDIRGVNMGIASNNNLEHGANWQFSGNTLSASSAVYSLGSVSGSRIKGVSITGGESRTSSTTATNIVISSENRFEDVYVGGGIQIHGGAEQLRIGANSNTVVGAIFNDAVRYSIVISGGITTLLGNTSRNPGVTDLNVLSGVEHPTMLGNNFARGARRNPIETYLGELPVTGTWVHGDRVNNITPTSGTYAGWVCTLSGTFGSLASVSANTTTGSATIVVSSSANLKVGDYIAVEGFAGGSRIISISGNNVTLSRNITISLSGAPVSFSHPQFKGFGLVEA